MVALINTLTPVEFTTREWFYILDALGWWDIEGHHSTRTDPICNKICDRLDESFTEYQVGNPDATILSMCQELDSKKP